MHRLAPALTSVAAVASAVLVLAPAHGQAQSVRHTQPVGHAQAVERDVVFPPRPLFWGQSFPDPSIVVDGTRWFGVATGVRARTRSSPSQYGGWTAGAPLLARKPAWARTGFVWAPDLERAPDGSWLAYFSVPVTGLTDQDDRCIGVATSPALDVAFTPDDRAPLVCPAAASTPPADDRVPKARLRRRGVIDPSSYIAADGRRFLLYRTQGEPSSIRIVRLMESGLRAQPRSTELLRDRGILENPVLVDRGGYHHLLLSRGDYATCRYATVWRRSRSLKRGYDDAEQHVLLDRATTGICGPGGADYVPAMPGSANRLFLHGWVCDAVNGPCPSGYSQRNDLVRRGDRVLYAATLRWSAAGPRLRRFVEGPAWTPPPPSG